MNTNEAINKAVEFILGGKSYSQESNLKDETKAAIEKIENFSIGVFKDCAKNIIKWGSLIKDKRSVKTVVPTIDIPKFISSSKKRDELNWTIIPELDKSWNIGGLTDAQVYCVALLYFAYNMINLRVLSAQLPLVFNYLRESLDKKYTKLEYEAYEYEVKPATGKNVLVAGIKVIDVFSERPFRVLLDVEIEGLINYGEVVRAISSCWPGQSWKLAIESDSFIKCSMEAIAVRFILGTDKTKDSTTMLTRASESDKIKDSAMIAAGTLRWFLTSWLN